MAASLSPGRTDLPALFAGGERSLPAQAADQSRPQADGWGVAWIRPGAAPFQARSAAPLAGAAPAFKKALTRASAPGAAIAHARAASNPAGLPRRRLITLENTQPFCGEGLIFAHNGTLDICREIKENLGACAGALRGSSDSEVLFRQVVKMRDAYGDLSLALEMALDEIWTVWGSCSGDRPGLKAPYRGLNIFVSDGRELCALCHYPAKAGRSSLLTQGWGWGELAYRSGPGGAVFASEPLDGGPWKKLGEGTLARAELAGGAVKISTRKINAGKAKAATT